MLQEILHLSDNDMEFVTNQESGRGLIFNGKQAIPFVDDYPKHLKLFKVFTTKAEDDVA